MDHSVPPISPFYVLDMHSWTKDKIRHKIVATTKRLYSVLNYNKLGVCFNDFNTLKYRSAIFSFPEKLPLSFSPPKSVSWESFQQSYMYHARDPGDQVELILKNSAELHVNEYIEGVMIHLFYDPRTSSWEIATKGGVGGKYSYYGNLSKDPMNSEKRSRPYFYDMFMEAFRENKSADINTLPFLESLPKHMCYIFMLQHPRNKIVLPIKRPVLYLIRVYYVMKHGVAFISPKYYEQWYIFRNMKGIVEFPKQLEFETKTDVESFFQTETTSGGNCITPGVAITNEFTGELTILKNPHYDVLKTQQKLKPLTQYQYLCHRRMGGSDNYLQLFPQYKRVFFSIENEYMNFIKHVHQCYINTHVFQRMGVDYGPKYAVHIQNIHKELYLPMMRAFSQKNRRNATANPIRRPKVTQVMILQYFDRVEPREMLYILNWDTREQNYASLPA
uniref:Uncharacterized protein n=1 Tax=viral metagenome TaxID=1070528 RepID=A0A6C0DNP7_9ZZZZ